MSNYIPYMMDERLNEHHLMTVDVQPRRAWGEAPRALAVDGNAGSRLGAAGRGAQAVRRRRRCGAQDRLRHRDTS
jgi:hypothetical protein